MKYLRGIVFVCAKVRRNPIPRNTFLHGKIAKCSLHDNSSLIVANVTAKCRNVSTLMTLTSHDILEIALFSLGFSNIFID